MNIQEIELLIKKAQLEIRFCENRLEDAVALLEEDGSLMKDFWMKSIVFWQGKIVFWRHNLKFWTRRANKMELG